MFNEKKMNEFIADLNHRMSESLVDCDCAESVELGEQEDFTVLAAFKMLRETHVEDTLAYNIQYAIFHAVSEAAQMYIRSELGDMGFLELRKNLYLSNSKGKVDYDPEADEMYCSVDVETFCRLAPDISEKKLEDLQYLQKDLDYQVAHAAKDLMARKQNVA